jgi:hypothetical protein
MLNISTVLSMQHKITSFLETTTFPNWFVRLNNMAATLQTSFLTSPLLG